MNARTITLYVVLIAAALASWYLARDRSDDEPPNTIVETEHHGFYLKNARILGTGDSGELLYEIEADRAEQQIDQSVDFQNVRLFYSPESEVPWIVQADKATIRSEEPHRVFLSGHVRAVSSGRSDQGDTEIRTDYLELDPSNFIAETNERVQIRLGERSLTATGMLASLDEDRLELKSNVSGKFFP